MNSQQKSEEENFNNKSYTYNRDPKGIEYHIAKESIRVVLESPFAGNVSDNIDYARKCMRDSLLRGEYPIASHLLYTQEGILDDDIPEERKLGIDAGLDWGSLADKTVVYMDYGISKGMKYGIKNAKNNNRPIEYRSIL